MNPKTLTLRRRGSTALALVCAVAIGPADAVAYARMTTMQPGARTPLQAEQQPYPSQDVAARIPADQLDSLVAPIALYPDPLLAQTLAASTYPMEIIQLQQWLARNPGLKGEALATAVANQPWDPSVQAMAALPDVVTRLSSDIQWTTDLGNAFLAQESEVMDAVQRMRQKARNTGALTSSTRQVVETRVVENHPVIVIEQADPEEVYVPWYNPTAVYGYPAYPYPSVYYPSGSYWTGAALAFGTGVALGSFWGHGGWGWNTGWGWGHNPINVNRNANFVRNSSFYRGGFANNRWRHNVAHRGAAPYANRAMAARYGGAYRGQPLGNRAAAARQQINRQGGNLGSTRAGALRSGAVGTAGRNFAGQRGTFNRGDRAVGTAGTLNRPGSLNRGNFNNRNFNRGNFNNRNFNRGNFNNRNFNRGNFSNRSFNRGNFNSGSFNRRDFGSRSFNRGNFGGRSFNRGSFGGGRSFRGGNRGGFGGGGRRGGFGGGGGRRGGGRR